MTILEQKDRYVITKKPIAESNTVFDNDQLTKAKAWIVTIFDVSRKKPLIFNPIL